MSHVAIEPIEAAEVHAIQQTIYTGRTIISVGFFDQGGRPHKALFAVPDNMAETVLKNLQRMQAIQLPRGRAIPCTTA